MTEHLSDTEIDRFTRGEATGSARIHAGRHLSACAHCRDRALQRAPLQRSTAAVVRSVSASVRHLDYETIEALVDRRLPSAQRVAAEAHLAACPACRREYVDLANVAGALAAPLPASVAHVEREAIQAAPAAPSPVPRQDEARRPAPAPAAPSPRRADAIGPVGAAPSGAAPRTPRIAESLWSQLAAKLTSLVGSGFGPQAAFATVVVAVGAVLILKQVGPGTGPVGSGPRDGRPTDARYLGRSADFDRSALAAFAATSPEANRALVARDYRVLGLLAERAAERGDALALSTLGLLQAEGLGRSKDPAGAEDSWRRAAALGDRPASENLEILARTTGATSGTTSVRP